MWVCVHVCVCEWPIYDWQAWINTTFAGAYGTVYRALDNDTGRYVAIKKVRVPLTDNGVSASTLREIALLKQLNKYEHANIVRWVQRERVHSVRVCACTCARGVCAGVRVCELILVAPRLNYLLTNLKNTLKSLRYGRAEITDKCARAPLCVCVCVCSLFSQSIRIWLLAGCVFIFRFTSNADLERHSKRRNCNDRCTATHTYTHMQWHMHIKC